MARIEVDLRVRYSAGSGHDFDLDTMRERLFGFPTARPIWMHPIVFSGPYVVEVSGKQLPPVYVCVDGLTRFRVELDPAEVIVRGLVQKGVEVEPTEKRKALRPRKSSEEETELKIAVGRESIRVYRDGTPLLSVAKPTDAYGRIGIFPPSSSDADTELAAPAPPDVDVLLDGNAKAWILGRIDERMRGLRAAFERTWDFPAHLPEELRAAVSRRAREHAARPSYPGESSPGRDALFERVRAWIDGGDAESAAALVAGLGESDGDAAFRTWMAALCLNAVGVYEEALEALVVVERLNPTFRPARLEAARALVGLRRADAALRMLRDLLVEEQLLAAGAHDEVRGVLDAVYAAGAPRERLRPVEATLLHTLRGPEWREPVEFVSRHYRVTSDLDKTVCQRVALELEEAFRHYGRSLHRAEHMEEEKFQVYVFAGESSYRDYVERLSGNVPAHTLGLFNPVLQQILVWNAPDSDALMNTVRHEEERQAARDLRALPESAARTGQPGARSSPTVSGARRSALPRRRREALRAVMGARAFPDALDRGERGPAARVPCRAGGRRVGFGGPRAELRAGRSVRPRRGVSRARARARAVTPAGPEAA
jgi:hypothetical protein